MVLLIYGASGFAKEVYDIVKRCMNGKYKKVYFIDDFAEEGKFYNESSIHFDSIKKMFEMRQEMLEGIVAVGEPVHREMLSRKLEESGIRLATIIDSTAIISPTASIAEGTIICERATIHADVKIGKGCIIHPYSVIGHDIIVGDYSVLSSFSAPGGCTEFGKRVYVGMHSAIKEKLHVGDDAIIGMGSVVHVDVPAGATVVGNPARVTRGNDSHKVFSK